MYNTDDLVDKLSDYLIICQSHPTKTGLASALNTSSTTIHNVIRGAYNGTPYGKKPHYNRVIANEDFCLIREVFDEYY